MKPSEVRGAIWDLAEAHGWLGAGQRDFARLSGADERTVRRWAAAERRMTPEALCLLLALMRDDSLVVALRDRYRPSGLPVSATFDRLLFALDRDTSLALYLRMQSAQ